jgi:4-amino-4-deoxy-L-arabinose transferase-like glycosyltransferase
MEDSLTSLSNTRNYLIKEFLIMIFVVSVSAIPHAVNMFNYPYYENDEGTYMSQSWSLVQFGELAPYTYWYDHAPFGWMFISGWTILTGGFFTFGFSVNSGRVLMLILHIIIAILLYLVAKKLTKSQIVGIIAVLFFSLSPLAIYFQRRVLLDNIMVFWLMLSLTTLVYYKDKVLSLTVSATFFALAILSKETAVIFIPAFLYLIYYLSQEKRDLKKYLIWLGVLGAAVSIYPLYALLRGEFFPAEDRVSLIGALQYHLSRDGGSLLDFESGSFWVNIRNWMKEDPLFLVLGIFSTLGTLIIGIKNGTARVIGLLSLTMWIFFLRGGLILEFYIIPAIPFMSLSIGYLANYLYSVINRNMRTRVSSYVSYIPFIVVGIALFFGVIHYSRYTKDHYNLYTADQTTPQIQGVRWVLDEGPDNAVYVIDNYGYVDIHEELLNNGKRVEWYWKVDTDPMIAEDVLENSAENIDYIAATPQMTRDLRYNPQLVLTRTALENSVPVVRFWNDGWGVEIFRTEY